MYALIAEFDPQRAAAYREVVEAQGLKAVSVRDGDAARRVLQSHGAPSLLITDLSLPNTDGFSLITDVRRLSPQDRTAILVFSAFPELRAAAMDLRASLGLADVADKKLSREALTRSVARALAALTGRARPSAEAVGPDELVRRILPRIAQTFRVPIVLVAMDLREQRQITAYLRLNQPHHAVQQWHVLQQVWATGEPLVIPDTARQSLFGIAPATPSVSVRGVAAVPLMTRSGRLVGVMSLLDFEPLTLTSHQLDLLLGAARRIADELARAYAGQLAGSDQPPQARTEESWAALERLAMTDALTGLANRRAGERALDREVARAHRSGGALSVALIDVDRFKTINDAYGHGAGDDVLCEVSRVLTATLRASDYAVRWGGDEFLVLLPDVPLAGALVFADRARTQLESLRTPGAPRVTVSVGIVELERDESARAALARADARLYDAKAAGRNRVAGGDSES